MGALIAAGFVGGAGGLGRCLGEGIGAKPPNNLFLCKTGQNSDCNDEYRVENISNYFVVTLNNVILTFSTIIWTCSKIRHFFGHWKNAKK